MAQVRLVRVIPSMHVHLCLALWLFSPRLSFVLYFVPPFSFQPFLMFTSALNERSRSNPLCDFRLGTVVTSDYETRLTSPSTSSTTSWSLSSTTRSSWQVFATPPKLRVEDTLNSFHPHTRCGSVAIWRKSRWVFTSHPPCEVMKWVRVRPQMPRSSVEAGQKCVQIQRA